LIISEKENIINNNHKGGLSTFSEEIPCESPHYSSIY